MKILIASDIHGDSYYASKIEEIINKEKVDKVILLGDLLYHGPRNDLPFDYDTKQTMKILNRYKDIIIAVRGNCDAEVDQMVLDFDISSDYKIFDVDGLKLCLTHGHLNHKLPKIDEEYILLNGHTHIYKLEDNYINPGSISLPKGNDKHTYIIYENRKFTIYDENRNKIIEKVY